MRRLIPPLLLLALLALAAGCGGAGVAPPPEAPAGNPEAGRRAIDAHGCGRCHFVPGVRSAGARVAPPLDGFSHRAFIAGRLPNNFENLVRWIRDPQDVDPETAMPDVGVGRIDAEDIAAYLLSLR